MRRTTLWVFAVVAVVVAVFVWGLLLYRHVDAAADFAFDVTVRTPGGTPLADTEILFVDNGFDDNTTKRRIERSVGRTGSDGRLAATFSYRYGLSYAVFRPAPARTFRVVFRRSDFGEVARDFDADQLPIHHRVYSVRFDIVVPGRSM